MIKIPKGKEFALWNSKSKSFLLFHADQCTNTLKVYEFFPRNGDEASFDEIDEYRKQINNKYNPNMEDYEECMKQVEFADKITHYHNAKFTKLAVKEEYDYSDSSYAVSCDQKFIFICGGVINRFGASNNIIVYDVDKKKFYKSQMNLPQKIMVRVLCIRNKQKEKYFVQSYVDNLFRRNNWNLFNKVSKYPLYLIQCCQLFFVIEYLHILQNRQHYKINIDDIIHDKF